MSSSHGDKRSSDVEMGEATSPAPIPTSPIEAPACVADHLSFREKLGVTQRDTGTLAGSAVPDASALPAGSSTTPILVEDKGRAADSMPPPPARKEIVLAQHAPSVVPVTQPKGQKRKFTKGDDGESSQQGGSSIASGLRGKFVSLIDGMISECGSETSRLTGELLELQGRWSETEAMLTAVKGSHSVKVSKLEIAIGELERDLRKTASSLLKEKKARKAKSSEVCRLQRHIENDAGLVSRGIQEAKDALTSEFQARLAKISAFLGSLECIRNRDLALATIEGGMAVRSSDVEMGEATSPAPIPTSPIEAPACVADHLSFREKLVRRQAEKEKARAGAELPSSPALAVAPDHGTKGVTSRDTGTLAGSAVPDASALPAGSSTTPILVEDKGRAADSMPPPPAKKEIVLALHAPSVVPVTQPKGQKRKFTKGDDGESSQQGGSSIALGLRGKFVSLIDGMISKCGSETSRLAGELLEFQSRWSETEAMLTAVKGFHSVKVSKHEIAIGELERELERDLGKTASSLLKEKKAKKAKSLEVRRLQRQIENDAGLVSRGIQEAKDALSSEFQARLAKISAFLGSLECIRNRDLALAMIEGGMAVVQLFRTETPPTLEAEEARLSGCKGDLAVVDGDFDLILADLKSACLLPMCSEGPEGKDLVLGGDATPGSGEVTGEEGE
ncbi:hypothetical protein DY000_02013456 [Brassica cretica]|uniref:Uncharacterized protein n=1 Tax=Brassica cretica TaxID=69181 RepID=A0ABQ7CWP2_BRACR|nr:hypothetical protein DY000_02013456 [Brassica cretica]